MEKRGVRIEQKRRYIKASIQVTSRGQYKGFEIQIPDNTFRIVGFKVTSSLSDSNLQTTKRYFGVGATGLNSSAGITALANSENISNKAKLFNVTAGAAEHVYYAQPKRLGLMDLYVEGIQGGFKKPVSVSVTDPETSFIEDYYLWESQEAQLNNGNQAQIVVK